MLGTAFVIALSVLGTQPAERAVVVRADDGTRLSGTLATPAGAGPHPLAIIVNGFGPSGRDGAGGLYLRLSDALLERGVATLRYDKRGAGASDGPPLGWLNGDLLARDLSSVAATAGRLALVDRRRVILVGHSQGGLLALRAGRGAPVAGVVTLGAPGRPLGEIAGGGGSAARLLPAIVGPAAARATLRRDPRADARRLRRPALLIHGDRDRVVPAGDMALLAAARAGADAPTATLTAHGSGHNFGSRGRPFPAPVARAIVRFAR